MNIICRDADGFIVNPEEMHVPRDIPFTRCWRKSMSTAVEILGFIAVMLGGSAMDSINVTLPVIVTLSGLGTMLFGYYLEQKGY